MTKILLIRAAIQGERQRLPAQPTEAARLAALRRIAVLQAKLRKL